MSRNSFAENRDFGKNAEIEVSEIMQRKGWHVIPSYDYSGLGDNKAPKITCRNDALVVPDLDAAKEGRRIWIEVKRYTAPAYNRSLGIMVHGIKRKHYQSYLQVQKITGCMVWLCVCEEDSGARLLAQLDRLHPYPCQCKACKHGAYNACSSPIKDCVYFDRSRFASV